MERKVTLVLLLIIITLTLVSVAKPTSASSVSRVAAGESFYLTSAHVYTQSVVGSAFIKNLSVSSTLWYTNGSVAQGKAVALQLSAVLTSPVGVFWAVFDAVFDQSALSFVDSVWNETSDCSGPGALDYLTSVQGKGSVVTSFPGCFGTHYQYSSSIIPFTLPINVTLEINVTQAKSGALSLLFAYRVNGGFNVNDLVTIYPGRSPVSSSFVVGGYTPLGFSKDLELVLCAPDAGETVVVNQINAQISLAYLEGASYVKPAVALSYSLDSLAGSENVSSYANISNLENPQVELSQGSLVQAMLWPVQISGEVQAYQSSALSPIQVEITLLYFDLKSANYTPLPNSLVNVTVNETVMRLPLTQGFTSFQFYPASEGVYVVKVSYPTSFVIRNATITSLLRVSSLSFEVEGNVSVPLNLTLTTPTGSGTSQVYLGKKLFILVPPQGVVLSVPEFLERNSSESYSFVGWYSSHGLLSTSTSLSLNSVQQITALYALTYLVTINNPYTGSVSMWVKPGGNVTLRAPLYVYVNANLVREVFVGWSNGDRGNTTITVNAPLNVSAIYQTQYKVYIALPNSVVINDYYPNGSVISYTAPSTLGGTFLHPNVFQGWTGTFESTSRSLKIVVTKPIVITAVYTVSDAPISDIEAFIALVIGALFAYFAQKKKW